jgi:hypothetical protein
VKGCKGTETGCIAGARVQLKPPRFSGGEKPGIIHGQIRIQIAQVRGFGCSISHSMKGKEGKGKGGHTLSAGEASDEELARAAPLPCRRRLERRPREREREREVRENLVQEPGGL